MSLFDSVFSSVMGKVMEQGGLAGALGGLLGNDGEHGGLKGLVERFQQAGLGDVIGSWIGKGENLPITAAQLQAVLGPEAVAAIAAKLGIDPAQAASHMSEILPQLVDKLTPHGHAPEGGLGNQADLAGMLGGLLRKAA